MARIAGVNIPDNKHAVISLTYVFGIGRPTARKICAEVGIAEDTKIAALDEAQLDCCVLLWVTMKLKVTCAEKTA